MKVISGKYKGKSLEGFDLDGTRPTQDRVKESLFSTIQNDINSTRCLDLFAGSGNLGIEALSNGSVHCTFVDRSRDAISIISKNLNMISVPAEQFTILHMDYERALKELSQQNQKFDLVFLDPPYKLEVVDGVLTSLLQDNLLEELAIVVVEYEFPFEEESHPELYLWKKKKYGYKYVNFYQYQKED